MSPRASRSPWMTLISPLLATCLALPAPVPLRAEEPPGAGAGESAAPAASASSPAHAVSPDSASNADEVDFTVINLPTTLALPRHAVAFRLTHRFARRLSQGSFSDLASDLFGLDGHAQIGLELRYGLGATTQIGVQRISDRTIELFAQQELARQGRVPVGIALLASLEGLNNFQRDYSPRLGFLFSRTLGARGTVYLVPMWVGKTSLVPLAGSDSWTAALGVGTRLRIGASMALLGEYTPRLAGYRPSGARDHLTFGIERRIGGHCFQLNVSNDIGTTPAQVARGQQAVRDWFIGFNLSRKFF
jgi:hypothetical protein